MANSVKVKVTGDTSDIEKRLKGLESKLKGFGSTATNVFKGMMMSQVVTKGLSLLKSGLESAASAGMSFEAAMSQVAAISGASADELERLEKAARNAGSTTKFSATEAANALNYMALAGWDADKSIAALDGVLNLAASSGMDLASASDMVTDFIAAFGMEAKDAAYMSDMMSYAQSRSNTSAQQLGEAYGNCASSMHAAGQDIETTTAMLEALANQGIKGSEAGTQMAAIMRDLTSKMENGKIMIGKTAVQVMDAAGNFRDLNDIIADVGKATEGMGTAEASAAIMTTFTARSVKAVQTILNEGMDNVNRYEDELRKSAGTATEQAETMIGNLQGDITIMKSALEGLQITAYDSFSGIARTGVQELTELINTLSKAGEKGGIAGMFDALLGELPKIIDKVMGALSSLAEQVIKRLPDFAKKLVNNLPVFMAHFMDIVPKLAQGLFEMVGAAVGSLIANLPKLVPQLMSGIVNMFTSAFNGAINGIGSILSGIGYAASDHTYENIMKGMLQGADKETVVKIQAAIEGDVDVNEAALKTDVDSTLERVREILKGTDLDEDTKTAIEESIKNSSGMEVFRATLQDLGLKEEDILAAETALHHARDRINKALASLGTQPISVQQAAFKYLENNAMSDEDKIAALEALGVENKDAVAIVQQYKVSRLKINDALTQYGITTPEAQAKAFEILTNDALTDTEKNKALIDLGIPPLQIAAFRLAVNGELDAIKAILGQFSTEPVTKQKNAFILMNARDLSDEGKKAALLALGIPEDALDAFMTDTANANAEIKKILRGIGGLGVAQKKQINRMLAEGKTPEEVSEALQKMGIDKETADGVALQLTTARDGVRKALYGLGGLTTTQKTQINKLLSEGAKEDDIKDALIKMGVDEATATKVAKGLTTASSNIDTALDGLGQLAPDQKQTIKDMAINGASPGEIHKALRAMGVPETDAWVVANQVTKAANSIGGALESLGDLTDEQIEVIEQMAYDGKSQDEIKDALIKYGVPEGEASKVANQVWSAANGISEAYGTLGKLDEKQQQAIYELATGGADADTIAKELEKYGIPPEEAQSAAKEIRHNVETVEDALKGMTGLNDTQKAVIVQMLSEGAGKKEISDYLQSLGYTKSEADKVADEIVGANDVLVAALMKLGLTEEQAKAIASGASSDEALIRSCLQQLGVPDSVIDEILGSYDSLTTGIAGKLNGLYDEIFTYLTDGKKETNEQTETLKDKIQAIAEQLASNIDTWMADEISNLDETDSEYAKKVKEIQDKGAEMKTALTNNAVAAQKFLDDMAGKGTAYCAEHMGELSTYMSGLKQVAALLDELTSGSAEGGMTVGELNYQLVATGQSTNTDRVGLAMKWLQEQKNAELAEYDQQWADARAAALKTGASDEELRQLDANYKELEDGAINLYEVHMRRLFAGLAQQDYSAEFEPLNVAQMLYDQLVNGDENGEDVDFTDDIIKQMEDALRGLGVDENEITGLQGIGANLMQALGDAINEYAPNMLTPENMPNVSAALKAAVEQGFFSLDGVTLDEAGLADISDDVYQQFFTMLFDFDENDIPVFDTEPITDTVSDTLTDATQEGIDKAADTPPDTENLADNMTEAMQGAVDKASKEDYTATPEMTVEPTVNTETETGEGTGMEDAIKDQLTTDMSMDINADITLKVSVSDSNAGAVGTVAGNELGSAMASELQSKAMGSKLSSATADLMVKVINMANACSSLMRSAGANAAEGFRLGLLSKIAQVEAAARKVANAAADAVSVRLEISSPSRLMRRLGDFTGAGFEQGLTESLDRAVHGAQRIVGALNLNPNTAANGIVSAINGNALDTDALGEAISRRPVVLNVNGREFARATQRDIQISQNNARRRVALSTGG